MPQKHINPKKLKAITIDPLLMLLEGQVSKFEYKKDAAANMKVSAQYLTDVRHRRRKPGKKLLEALGLQRMHVYVDPTGQVIPDLLAELELEVNGDG